MATKRSGRDADMVWRNRIVGHADVDPATITANPRNWRTHPASQRAALDSVLGEVGWVQSVVINQQTGFLIDGHARVAQAVSRKESSVPVVYVDLSPDEEALVLATLDPIGTMAGAQKEQLTELLAGVQVGDELRALLNDTSCWARKRWGGRGHARITGRLSPWKEPRTKPGWDWVTPRTRWCSWKCCVASPGRGGPIPSWAPERRCWPPKRSASPCSVWNVTRPTWQSCWNAVPGTD